MSKTPNYGFDDKTEAAFQEWRRGQAAQLGAASPVAALPRLTQEQRELVAALEHTKRLMPVGDEAAFEAWQAEHRGLNVVSNEALRDRLRQIGMLGAARTGVATCTPQYLPGGSR